MFSGPDLAIDRADRQLVAGFCGAVLAEAIQAIGDCRALQLGLIG